MSFLLTPLHRPAWHHTIVDVCGFGDNNCLLYFTINYIVWFWFYVKDVNDICNNYLTMATIFGLCCVTKIIEYFTVLKCFLNYVTVSQIVVSFTESFGIWRYNNLVVFLYFPSLRAFKSTYLLVKLNYLTYLNCVYSKVFCNLVFKNIKNSHLSCDIYLKVCTYQASVTSISKLNL